MVAVLRPLIVRPSWSTVARSQVPASEIAGSELPEASMASAE
jgi:hypothetical protein